MDGIEQQPNPETPEGGTPPAPSFVPSEEFKSFQATMQGTLSGVTEALNQIRSEMNIVAALRQQPHAPAAPAAPAGPEDVSDAEIEQAIAEGRGAQVFRKAINAAVSRAEQKLLKEHVEPLRTTGLGAISELTLRAARAEMPYYDRYKKEIDAHIQSLAPELRLNPQVYKLAHDAVVGTKVNELLAEAQEKAVRGAAPAPAEKPGAARRTGRDNDTNKVPTVEELMGKDAADALAARGMSADDHARRLGYKDWAAYAALALKEDW